MAALRFLASVFALAAIITLVADLTRAANAVDGHKHGSSLAAHWEELAPGSFKATRTFVADIAGLGLWDGLIAPILAVPAFLMFALLSAATGYAGRRRNKVNVFIN